MSKDYYKVLGVAKKASSEEIKKAYYKLAHRYHPDKGSGDEQKFKEINEAYQVLSDKEKRQQYDSFGRTFEGNMGGGQPGSDFQWSWGRPSAESDFGFEDLNDMLGEMFGFGSGRKRARKDLKRGRDIKVEIEVSLEDTLKGTEKTIVLDKNVVCSRCHGSGAEPGTKIKECFSCRGTGHVQQVRKTFLGTYTQYTVCPECGGEGYNPEKPCNVCTGEGRVKEQEEINFFIPAGVDTGQIIKIEGKGNAGRRKGRAGDLYVRITVKQHAIFERKGDDLYVGIPISFSQAALGDKTSIPSLEGKEMLLKIPAGTESGKVFRISGKGIPHFTGYGRGDLYIKIKVKTPERLTRKQKEILEKLKEEGL